MSTTPRSLVMTLVLGAEARGAPMLSVRELLAGCSLFGHAESSTRVALARAVGSGLLVTPKRGFYGLGERARPVADEVGRWRQGEARTVAWTGRWVAVHVGAMGRSDRAALRARERAFELLGFAEFERGLHLRPDNLMGGCGSLRERLNALLPEGSEHGTVFTLDDLAPADLAHARSLWDCAGLDAAYREETARMTAWLEDADSLPLDRAAREIYDMVNEAIRRLVFDPLLPAPLVDTEARARFRATVLRMEGIGREIWYRFLGEARPAGTRDPASGISDSPTEETLR